MNTAKENIYRRNIRVIDKIVNNNKDNIIEAIVEAQIDHAYFGMFNRVESIYIQFDLEDEETYKIVSGQGYSMDLYKKALDGRLINVYTFQSGQLSEAAEESVLLYLQSEDIDYDVGVFNSEVAKKVEEFANVYADIDINYDNILDFDLSYLLRNNE